MMLLLVIVCSKVFVVRLVVMGCFVRRLYFMGYNTSWPVLFLWLIFIVEFSSCWVSLICLVIC